MSTARAHLIISGRVQGVFYRVTCQEQASARGLSGWVRNIAAGSVEAIAEGDRGMIEEFIAWCHEGPSGARVTGVKVDWEAPQGEFEGFRITG